MWSFTPHAGKEGVGTAVVGAGVGQGDGNGDGKDETVGWCVVG